MDQTSRGSTEAAQVAADVTDAAAKGAVAVQRHPGYRALVHVGLCLYGLVHLLLAWLAAQVALGRNVDASNQGSLASIAHLPLGRTILVVTGVGMLALALWQAIEAALGYPYLRGRERLVRRVASAFRAVVYTSLALACWPLVSGGRSDHGDASARETAAALLSLPGGSLLVGLVGVGVAVAAGDQLQRGLRRAFVRHDMQGTPPRWAVALGVLGWTAKGAALTIVAVLFWLAAWHHRAAEAGGLDLALTKLRGAPAGRLGLWLVAAGFAAFGIFCFVWARFPRHDAQVPDEGSCR